MTEDNKGRDRWHGATPSTSAARNSTSLLSCIKFVIVRLAVRAVITAKVATWLIQRGGMKDA